MNFDNYIFRSHMVGSIVNVPKPLTKNQSETFVAYTDKGYANLTPKQKITFASLKTKHEESKKYNLTDSQKVELSKLAYAHIYGRTTSLNSPMITKGIEKEKEARDLLSRVSGLFLTANEERKSNDWVTGKTDIKLKGIIPDIKTSWSWESFSKLIHPTSKTNGTYFRQLDSYMDLWDVKHSLLCHILVDTPFDLVEREIKHYDYKHNVLNMDGDVREECIPEVKSIISNHIFSRKGLEEFCHQSSVLELEWFPDFKEIPEHERVHMIPHEYDKIRIEQRNECILLAREFMNTVTAINNFDKSLLQLEKR